MITYAADTQKQNVIDAWKISFPNDSEAFVDFYFEKKYRNEDTLLLFKDGEMASCLQMLPYKMTYYEKLIKTSYISGAATLPAYQNQGLMKKLLIRAFKEMLKRKDVLTTLIPQEPWLIDFYKKLGYTSCFEYKLRAINPNDYPRFPDRMRFKEFQLADYKAAHSFYKRQFIKQNSCIQKSIADFSVMVEACQNFDGNVYVLIDKGSMVGLCFCFFANGKVILKDCITRNAEYQQYFLSKLTQRISNQDIFMYSPVAAPAPPLTPPKEGNFPSLGGLREAEEIVEMGMARILDAPRLLALFAKFHPHLTFSIKIADKYILENNITAIISDGKIRACRLSTVDFELSIEKLTRLLLGYRVSEFGEKYAIFPEQHPYMSLMLE